VQLRNGVSIFLQALSTSLGLHPSQVKTKVQNLGFGLPASPVELTYRCFASSTYRPKIVLQDVSPLVGTFRFQYRDDERDGRRSQTDGKGGETS